MKKRLRPIIYIIFGVYMVILFKITVFRSGVSFLNLFQSGAVTFDFFDGYMYMLRNKLYYEFVYLFVGNIIWFVPFGFLQPCMRERFTSLWRVLLSGFLLSFSIEFLQFAFGTGISEVDDLILNTLGALIGYYAYRLILRLKSNHTGD